MVRRTGNQRPVARQKEDSGYEKVKKRKKYEEEDKQQGAALLKLFKKVKDNQNLDEGIFIHKNSEIYSLVFKIFNFFKQLI